MPDTRNAQRSTVRQRSFAVLGGHARVECTIRDISATGARLNFRNPTFLPRRFTLEFNSEAHPVIVKWQSGRLAGVRFQTPVRLAAPPRARPSIWRRRGS